MIYRLFYFLIKFTCYFYFKKTRIYHPENLDLKKPLIICANHGNSFMDAILIAIHSRRTLHFLVRADVFNTPFKRWFFWALNMMPIYRIRDGREAIKNNDSIFLKCKKVLENNGAIVIFPEGNCIVEKRLRAFKTGFVHLAFNTPLKGLQVLPLAINYSNPDEFYTDASLHFLQPISVEEIKLLAEQKEFEFNKLLMKKTQDSLKQQMVYIPNAEDDEFFEQVLALKRNSAALKNDVFVKAQIETAEALTQLKLNDSQKFETIKGIVLNYFDQLKINGIDDLATIANPISLMKIVWLFPLYYCGNLLNIIPSNFLKNIVNTKIKERQFKSSVRMVLSLFTYLIYMLIVSFLLNFAIDNYSISLAIIFVLMLCYYASFSVFNVFKQQKRLAANPNKQKELTEIRRKITTALNL